MKIRITTDGPKLVSFWDIYGKELEVKDTKTVNFASGPKTFYITEFEGREYEVPEDMVEKSIPNNYDGKSVQEVWDSLTPKQREHFITDHFNEINANGNFGTSISLSNMVENLSYNGTNNEGISLPVEVKRSFTKHVSSGQYGKGKKVDLGIAIKGEFTTDGENYFSGWYFQGQDWNGFKVPYFEYKEAREVIESLEGLSVGRLYGGKLSDKGWWYAEPGTAPADRTVITGQKIQTTDGEKEVWSIGGFEWTWSLKDEQAGDGAKIEKMENKYYYLPIGRIFKDSGGVRFQISGYTPEGLKIKRYSEVEKDTAEAELSFGAVPTLAEDKKITFEGATLETWRDMRLLELEIDSIKKQLTWEDSRNTYQAELEQAADKIDKLNAELHQVKKEANTLMDDLGKKSSGFKDSLDAMEAIARKDKAGKGKEVEVGEASVYVELINGNIKVYHGADFKAKEKPYFLLKIKNAKPGSWDKIWDALRKIKSGNPKDGGVASIYIELSKGNITVYHGSSFELTGSKNELLSRDGVVEGSWLKIWEVLDGIKKASKAGKGKEVVSPCTDCDTKLKAFIAKFPNNAKSWAQATDEMRDLARELREYYNEQNDLAEGEKGYIDGLPFREFKKPSEWNTKAKKQILSTWKKLSKEQKEDFASNNSFLNPDND